MAQRSLSICLINPRFTPSFFGSEYVLPLLPGDKRSHMANGAVLTLAALVPGGHHVVVMDENVEELDFERLRHFDIIGVTGMIVQRQRMHDLLLELKKLPALICLGGPYVTVDEEFFAGLADVTFIGEAEETWPAFLDDLAAGRPTLTRYKQEHPTDMSRVPTPRFDLVDGGRYLYAPVQFSRGCPFLCEFCDIIVMFGRKPRLKEPAQILAELDAAYAAGFRRVFMVDDNFIGNKVKAKELLREITAWQQRLGFPLTLTTEASINLADDAELLDLMHEANITNVFIGIETPRMESLMETRKVQNVRGDSLSAKLTRIRDAGLVIMGGFMVGFDHDDEAVFDEQYEFIQDNGIGISAISILSPIPSTPLYDRLKSEGRLLPREDAVWFQPKQMSRDTLLRKYNELNQRIYAADSYFDRIYAGYAKSSAFRARRKQMDARVRHRNPAINAIGTAIVMFRLAATIVRERAVTTVGRKYLSAYRRHNLPLGRERMPLSQFVSLCVHHWHMYKVSLKHGTYWSVEKS